MLVMGKHRVAARNPSLSFRKIFQVPNCILRQSIIATTSGLLSNLDPASWWLLVSNPLSAISGISATNLGMLSHGTTCRYVTWRPVGHMISCFWDVDWEVATLQCVVWFVDAWDYKSQCGIVFHAYSASTYHNSSWESFSVHLASWQVVCPPDGISDHPNMSMFNARKPRRTWVAIIDVWVMMTLQLSHYRVLPFSWFIARPWIVGDIPEADPGMCRDMSLLLICQYMKQLLNITDIYRPFPVDDTSHGHPLYRATCFWFPCYCCFLLILHGWIYRRTQC